MRIDKSRLQWARQIRMFTIRSWEVRNWKISKVARALFQISYQSHPLATTNQSTTQTQTIFRRSISNNSSNTSNDALEVSEAKIKTQDKKVQHLQTITTFQMLFLNHQQQLLSTTVQKLHLSILIHPYQYSWNSQK